MRCIVIANQKGGVGKTTTAVTLGAGLALKGKRTLIVDCDPQGQVATFLGLRQESGLFDLLVGGRPLADVTRSASVEGHTRTNLRIVPGNKRTATAQMVMASEGFRLDCLADVLPDADADYIIFDTSPSVGLLQEAALFAADWLIAPVAVDYPAAEGLAGVLVTLKAVEDRGGRCRLLFALPTMYDDVTRESKATLDQLKERLGEAVFAPVHRATVLRECAAEGVTVWEKAPESRAAEEYARLLWEVLNYGQA
jgi:chromosome partitioning protein